MKRSLQASILIALQLASGLYSHAAEIYAKDVPLTEDFNSFKGAFATLPSGFSISKNASEPMLPSDSDFRGVKSNSVTTGGCYAWAISATNMSLGCQPTGDDFSPGWFMLTLTNLTGSTATEATVAFDILCRNNADRMTTVNLAIAGEDGDFKTETAFIFTSEGHAGLNSDWVTHHRSGRIRLKKPVRHAQTFFIRWYITDAGGSGSRDEIGLDNLSVTITRPRGTSIHIQ